MKVIIVTKITHIKATSSDDHIVSKGDNHIDDCEKKEESQLPSNADKEIQDPYRMLKIFFAGAQKNKKIHSLRLILKILFI